MSHSQTGKLTYFVLSGADGSGKTTIAKLLASYLSLHGSTRVHWFRGTHLLASILVRVFSRFKVFRGTCNPYYGVCIPGRLKPLWFHIEFWSLLPHVFARFLFKMFYRFLICDRGFLDFIVWVIVTLGYPAFLRNIYGRFLLRLAVRERPIYLYGDLDVLAVRADVPRWFIVRELAVYNVLSKYVSLCSVNTGDRKPLEVLEGVLKCLGNQIR